MKRLLSLVALVPLLTCSVPAKADLGPAEKIKTEFDAWCGKSGSNCKVAFSGDTLTIDNAHSITKADLNKFEVDNKFYCTPASGFSSAKCYGKGAILIYYTQAGKEGAGAVIFADDNAFFDFETAMNIFCGSKCRPLGPSIKVQ